ncbi:hypothetical protein DRQ53_13795 [bacterium]|nr:MAG: hypothetical protein DRQ53_13795 [bacterium]
MLNMKRMVLMLLALTVIMVMGVNTAMAEPRDNVYICHHDKDLGTWELINVNGNSTEKHMANHDDGMPNATTSMSGTTLDGNCEERLPFCGNCLVGHAGPGCDNAACEATVGSLDPFCVDVEWDSICAEGAMYECVGVVCDP